MIEPEERTFVDAEGVTIHYYVWSAENPVAIVQLAHGLGEYARRHGPLAEDLCRVGFTVYANDHRGHGQTGLDQWAGDHAKLGKLGPGGLRAAVADLHQLTGIIHTEHPTVPIVLLGHSWGSLMAQMLLNEQAPDFAAAVLTGTAYRMPGLMAAGDLNKNHRHLGSTGYEWLSRDPEVAQAFAADPLCFTADALKLFGLRDGIRLFGLPKRNLGYDIPILIQIGSEDPLGGDKSVHRLADAYTDRSGLSDVRVFIYPDARHEVFNETNRGEVVTDLTVWLHAHLTGEPQP